MAFADVAANLRLNISDFSSKLGVASKQLSGFASRMNKEYGDASKSLTKYNFGLKDTARIVQGIIVAQAFYQGARAIREATSALWDFNKSLDYAHVTYSALFGDTQLASNFMSVLKEHSIETIFDYQNLADASKKLLAYGIEYENLMFVMEGLTNLGAMSGDTAALDRISLALGQIYTRGKLTAEEMRQLANAYVPISDIVQQQFKLTPDQMGKIGKLNLPAGEVINAVVDYANNRFASVGDAAMLTITGLQNKIVDTLKVMGVEMLAPITTAYKSFLNYIAGGLEAIRSEFSSGGAGGVFEFLVPDPNTQQMVRQFIANVQNLFMSLMSVGVVVGQVFGNFAHVIVSAFNVVAPVITQFTNLLAATLNGMLSTRAGATALRIALLGAAAAFVVLRVHAMSALVITTVTKAVMGLSRALLILASIISRNPIIALLAGLAITLVGISTASNNADSGLNRLFDTISGAGGASSGDILQGAEESLESGADAMDDFNNRFEEGAGAADGLADSLGGVGGAADKAKKKLGLLSFDEVFKLNDAASGSGGGGGGLASDIEGLIDGLGGLGGALVPEIPDFSDFVDDFTDGLFGGLRDGILAKAAAFGLGAWLAAKLSDAIRKMPLTGFASVGQKIARYIFSAISGAFVGLAYDALVSPLTDKLWEALENAFSLSENASKHAELSATIGAAIGGALGMVLGGIPGSIVGAAAGQLGGGLVGLVWEEIGLAFSNSVVGLGAGIAGAIANAFGMSFRTIVSFINFRTLSTAFSGIGTAIKATGIKAVAKGGIIGMAIGFITDAIAALLWNSLAEKFALGEGAEGTAKVGQTIGSVIGTVIGGLMGGPAGALIGTAIGTFAGGIVGLFWAKIKERFATPDTAVGATIGATIGTFFGPVGTAIGATVGAAIGAFWEDISTGFSEWWAGISAGFNDWWSELTANWGEWMLQNTVYLVEWLNNLIIGWVNAFGELKTMLDTWWTNLSTSFVLKQEEILGALSTWWSNTKSNWSTRYAEIKSTLSIWWTGVASDYSDKMTTIMNSLTTWWSDTASAWSTKYGEIKNNLTTWWNDVLTDTGVKLGEILVKIRTKLDEVKTAWSTKWDNIKTEFSEWWSGLKTDMGNWLEQYVWKPIADFFNLETFWNRIKGLLDAIKQRVSGWWSGLTSSFSVAGASISINPNAGLTGHATGGIFNREHIARFAEGDKAEAVIPLENASAMQPFVNAISDGILQGLMPVMATNSGNASMPPMYVGTLIADDRGLRQLYKKFEVIEAQEAARKGFA